MKAVFLSNIAIRAIQEAHSEVLTTPRPWVDSWAAAYILL